jgi:serine/threonine protein kinase
MQDSL